MREKPLINRRIVLRIALGLLLLGLIGSITGVFIFRNGLRPSQQQRIINILPFTENFLSRPPENYSLPTPVPATSEISPEDLLNSPLELAPDDITPDTQQAPIQTPQITASPTS